jgi:hypothetical protein
VSRAGGLAVGARAGGTDHAAALLRLRVLMMVRRQQRVQRDARLPRQCLCARNRARSAHGLSEGDALRLPARQRTRTRSTRTRTRAKLISSTSTNTTTTTTTTATVTRVEHVLHLHR